MVRGGYHLNSDRWPIDGSLRLERRELWSTVKHNESRNVDGLPRLMRGSEFS